MEYVTFFKLIGGLAMVCFVAYFVHRIWKRRQEKDGKLK